MTGEVTTGRRQAIILLRLRGQDNSELDIDAVIDTGFTEFLTLPSALIEELDLARRETTLVILADGSKRWVKEYEGRILWNDEWYNIPIQASDGDPLVGMALMHEHLLTIEVQDQGSVSIEPLA